MVNDLTAITQAAEAVTAALGKIPLQAIEMPSVLSIRGDRHPVMPLDWRGARVAPGSGTLGRAGRLTPDPRLTRVRPVTSGRARR